MADPNLVRVPRQIITARFPDEWPLDLVRAFEELFTAANGGIEGEDFIFDMVTGLDATTRGGLLVAQTDALGQLSVSDLSDAGILDLINGLTVAADDFIFFSDSTTAAVSKVTAFARTLLDDTTAATMRTTLGLKALAILDGLEVEDEGISVVSDVTTFNYVGPNVIVSDVAGVATVTITQITDEEVEDIVGALVANTTTITFTYDDATPALTADVNTDSITFVEIQNAIANSKLVGSGAAGVGIDYTEITLGTNLSMSGTTLNATGGSTTFTGLTDTPANYTSQALKIVQVNAGETALEFVSAAAATTFVGLSDTPANYTGAGGKAVQVNAGATALEFVTPGGGGGSLLHISTNVVATAGDAFIDVAVPDDTHTHFKFMVSGLIGPNNAQVVWRGSADGGTTFESGAAAYKNSHDNSDLNIGLSDGQTLGNGRPYLGSFDLVLDPAGTQNFVLTGTSFSSDSAGTNRPNVAAGFPQAGYNSGDFTLDFMRIFLTAGDMDDMRVVLWGYDI